MDIGVIFLEDGEPKEMFDYYSSSYSVPEKDASQDWKLDKDESKTDDDSVELHFSRKLVTNDAEKVRKNKLKILIFSGPFPGWLCALPVCSQQWRLWPRLPDSQARGLARPVQSVRHQKAMHSPKAAEQSRRQTIKNK